MRSSKRYLYIFSHNVEPNGISGGETILIETFKRIASKFTSVTVYTWQPGFDLYAGQGFTNATYRISKLPVLPNFYVSFLVRTLYGIWLGLTLKLPYPNRSYLYFSSDFLPDSLPVIFLKLRYPNAIFISNFYLAAPNPFVGFNEKGGIRLPTINGIFFWLLQKPIYFFSKRYADIIFVTSEPDVDRFPKQKAQKKYFIVQGGVNISSIKEYLDKNKNLRKIYDAVFMGRFHPQKGVVELLGIWKEVVNTKKDAHLIMIGDGPLMPKVKSKIRKLKLQKNITLTGYIFDREARYKIFSQSKMVLHPAIYDSGGMAAAEAMAFGLPAVSFDLLALKTYYPKGMIKVEQGNVKEFAKIVLDLLKDRELYKNTKEDAISLVETTWDWDIRAKQIARKILSI